MVYLDEIFFGLIFMFVYEVASWPLRIALAPIPMSGDVRRMISRLAGPAIIAIAAWLGAHFGIPLGRYWAWIWVALFMLLGFGAALAQGHVPNILKIISPVSDTSRWKRELFVELSSVFIFISFLIFRSTAPEMTTFTLNGYGSEKFDNAMFFWSAFHATEFPPMDYWLGPERMAYYYYGQYFWGFIGRLAAMPGAWVITLGMTRLVPLVWESGYLLIRAFGIRPVSAAIGAFFVAWGCNPHAWMTARDQYNGFVGRAAQSEDQRGFIFDGQYLSVLFDEDREWNWGSYAFWDTAHGVIVNDDPNTDGTYTETITEHPAWTAILGDFHAHHHSFPWNIAFVALIIAGDRWFRLRLRYGETLHALTATESEVVTESKTKKGKKKKNVEIVVEVEREAVLAPTFSAGLIRAVLFGVCLFTLGVSSFIASPWVGGLIGLSALGLLAWRIKPTVLNVAARLVLIALIVLGLFGGFKLMMGTLENPVTREGPVLAEDATFYEKFQAKSPVKFLPREVDYASAADPNYKLTLKSEMSEIFAHWGFHIVLMLVGIFAFSVLNVPLMAQRAYLFGWATLVGLALLFLIIQSVAWKEPILLWMALGMLSLMLCVGRQPWFRPLGLLFFAAVCLLLGGLELFYIDDPMGALHERYNSYFKLCFPAWGIMTAGVWVMVNRVWKYRPFMGHFAATWGLRLSLLCVLIPFASGQLIFGVPNRIETARYNHSEDREPTLSAVEWLQWVPGYENEHAMLDWVRENVPPGEIVAELIPMDRFVNYAYHGRVASLAGRPVPVGWDSHEYTWRSGEAAAPVAVNKRNMQDLYHATTPEAMQQKARQMGVKWIVFGKPEHEIYGVTSPKTNNMLVNINKAAKLKMAWPKDKPEVYVFKFE